MAQAKAGCGQSACGVEDVLQLLRILYIIGGDAASNTRTMQEGTKGGDRGKVEVKSFCAVPPAAFDLILDFEELQFNAAPEEFTSKKITTKILQQIEVSSFLMLPGGRLQPSIDRVDTFLCFQEPLALASGALPDWCEQLTAKCPFLIPFETRQLYFTCTAFGASRCGSRLQNVTECQIFP